MSSLQRLYVLLRTHCDGRGRVWLSTKEMCQRLGISDRHLLRLFNKLKDEGLIYRVYPNHSTRILYVNRTRPMFLEAGPDPEKWKPYAACRGSDVHKFFPERDEGAAAHEKVRLAKETCSRCSVRQQCLEYAVNNEIQHGIWGGMSLPERRAWNRKRRISSVSLAS